MFRAATNDVIPADETAVVIVRADFPTATSRPIRVRRTTIDGVPQPFRIRFEHHWTQKNTDYATLVYRANISRLTFIGGRSHFGDFAVPFFFLGVSITVLGTFVSYTVNYKIITCYAHTHTHTQISKRIVYGSTLNSNNLTNDRRALYHLAAEPHRITTRAPAEIAVLITITL